MFTSRNNTTNEAATNSTREKFNFSEKQNSHTVFLDSAVEVWRHTGHNVVGGRHGLGARLLVEPAGLREVPGGKAVHRAAEPLRPERAADPPRPEPASLRRPGDRPEDEQRSETAEQAHR
jgi:hypothetical protein